MQEENAIRRYTETFLSRLDDGRRQYIMSADFKKLRISVQVFHVYTHLKNFRMFIRLRAQKNNEIAMTAFRLGNILLEQRKFEDAMYQYNKSLCYANTGSELLAYNYANRSQIFFEWKMYDLCMKNIELARQSNFPHHLSAQLNQRADACTQKMSDENWTEGPYEKPYIPPLSYEPNEGVPFVINALHIRALSVHTTQPLYPGDIIAVEKAYSVASYPEYHYTRCADCLLQNYYDLFPCPGCSQLMFCSKTCQRQAWENYHEIECPIIEALMEIYNSSVLGIRVLLRALKNFRRIDEIARFATSVRDSRVDPFSLNYTSEESALLTYMPIHTLENNIEPVLEMVVATSLTMNLILKHTILRDTIRTINQKHDFITLLYHNLQVTSKHSIKARLDKFPLGDSRNSTLDSVAFYATGIFNIASHYSISCAPNVLLCYIKDYLVSFVIKDIPVNEYICANTPTYIHYFVPKPIRQVWHMRRYGVPCLCKGCEDSKPMITSMDMIRTLPLPLGLDVFRQGYNMDKAMAIEYLQEVLTWLKNHSIFYLAQQYGIAIQYLVLCVNVISECSPMANQIEMYGRCRRALE